MKSYEWENVPKHWNARERNIERCEKRSEAFPEQQHNNEAADDGNAVQCFVSKLQSAAMNVRIKSESLLFSDDAEEFSQILQSKK